MVVGGHESRTPFYSHSHRSYCLVRRASIEPKYALAQTGRSYFLGCYHLDFGLPDLGEMVLGITIQTVKDCYS